MVMSALTFPGDLFADFDELQRQFERVFSRNPSSSIRAVGRAGFPAINVGTTPDAVEIYAFAAGVDPASLDVSVDKGLLTIQGERKVAGGDAQGARALYAHERFEGAFRRVVTLPEDADPSKVEARYRDGLLKIRVEKREASRPRRIEVSDAR